jgi:hypothetical protein
MEEDKPKLEGGIIKSTLVSKASFESIPGNKEKKFYKIESSEKSFKGEPEFFLKHNDITMDNSIKNTSPIRIQIQSAEGLSGQSISPNSNEITLNLSVKLCVTQELFLEYKNIPLTVEDLNKLIENRV